MMPPAIWQSSPNQYSDRSEATKTARETRTSPPRPCCCLPPVHPNRDQVSVPRCTVFGQHRIYSGGNAIHILGCTELWLHGVFAANSSTVPPSAAMRHSAVAFVPTTGMERPLSRSQSSQLLFACGEWTENAVGLPYGCVEDAMSIAWESGCSMADTTDAASGACTLSSSRGAG